MYQKQNRSFFDTSRDKANFSDQKEMMSFDDMSKNFGEFSDRVEKMSCSETEILTGFLVKNCRGQKDENWQQVKPQGGNPP